MVKNNSLDLMEYRPQCCDDQKLFRQMFEEYEEYKTRYQLIDFDDMLLKAYQCMQENQECLAWLRDKYQYIQVDEYQDTNFLQRDLIYLLAGEHGNLAVVGDDDQSIYGFRGARPEVMLRFQDFYPDVQFVRMNTNYRSCSGIIKAADQLIKNNSSRFEKEFQAFHEEEGTVRQYVSKDCTEEITKVAAMIQELIQNGEEPSDIAILYRTNQQAELVADTMMSMKIPFVSSPMVSQTFNYTTVTGSEESDFVYSVDRYEELFMNYYNKLYAQLNGEETAQKALDEVRAGLEQAISAVDTASKGAETAKGALNTASQETAGQQTVSLCNKI